MNVFYLDPDPEKCAQFHADRHVVKMAVETAQILCSVYFCTGESYLSPYKKTHLNHPSCIWARYSLTNWLWLRALGLELCREYTYRYGRIHKCEDVINSLETPSLFDCGFMQPPCVMDEKFIISISSVANYRNYYRLGKKDLLTWKNREAPWWL